MDRIDRRSLMLGIGAVAAAGPAMAQGTPRRGGTLTVGFEDNTRTLDPTFSIQFGERQILYLIYNTLVAIEPDFSLKPELAKAWTIENDGKRYVFELQAGVKFHDGTAFDAAAVKWNIDRRLDEAVASPQRNQLRPLIDNVEVIGPLMVAINLRSPHPGLLADMADRAGCMVSPAAAQRFGQDFGRNPVGTGAFVFRNWTQGTSITLERNPDYWEANATWLDRVVFRSTPNTVIGLQRLIVGEVDFVDALAPDSLRQIQGREGITTDRARVGRWYSFQYQVDKPPFDNAKLRLAIATALDRDRINQITMDGQATIANGPTPQGLWWSSPDTIVHAHDPARARALLAEAGVAPGTTLTLTTPSEPLYRRINQLVVEQLGAVGLQVTLAPVAQSEFYARVVSRAINFVPINWTQRADPDGLFYILFHSKGFANTTGYSNPEVDAMLDAARRTVDREERRRLYAAVKDQLMRDLPYIPLYFAAEFAAYNRRLVGVVKMPDNIPRFRYAWKAA
ncbi:ABC transporter substrate-binding protein [Humitalea sp. 24SJ18S-53]|uniref:ABC transporter substrate-binding protein n=1 Tax=Humitalea sp. 24SJ18S-53 TaxID=3422307 RepID=UPI003D677ABD